MAIDDRRIAWLLTAEAYGRDSTVGMACLSAAAEAGFRVVAMDRSAASGGVESAIEAEAMRLGMQCMLVDGAAHFRLGAGLSHAERRSLAQALSRRGFDGIILCEGCDSRTTAESLLATARVLLRDLDQCDWESYH